MDRDTYKLITELLLKIPPKLETPEGQKFHIGEIVKISKPNTWFSQNSFLKDKERLYEIEYSYTQKYGGSDEISKKQYCLKHLFEDNSSAWYYESELELVKGIKEITEERDLKEYERLKKKFNGA